jgi:hypothetical protein
MNIDLEIHKGSEEPPRGVAGYFLAWLHCSDRPIVIYRGTLSTQWRHGAQAVRVDAWAGPLPERTVRA